MKNFISSLELVPEDYIEHRRFYDRFTSLHYAINNNRNRLAATTYISHISVLSALITDHVAYHYHFHYLYRVLLCKQLLI